MSRIFIDIGSHQGQTIDLLLKRRFKVDHIIGLDPSPLCHDILDQKFANNPKVTIVKHGLWSETCEMDLHNEGSQGATVHDDYETTCNPEIRVTKCSFVKASDWFAENISAKDEVFLKLNCEGSECVILMDLIKSDEFSKVQAAFIDYDVRKSPKARPQEAELRALMEKHEIDNVHTYMGDSRHMILYSVVR